MEINLKKIHQITVELERVLHINSYVLQSKVLLKKILLLKSKTLLYQKMINLRGNVLIIQQNQGEISVKLKETQLLNENKRSVKFKLNKNFIQN